MDKKLFKKNCWFHENTFLKREDGKFVCTFDGKRFKTESGARCHIRSTATYKLQEYYYYEDRISSLKRFFKLCNDELMLLKSMDWRQFKKYQDKNSVLNKTNREWKNQHSYYIEDLIIKINRGKEDLKKYKAERNACFAEYKRLLAKETLKSKR